MAGQIANPADRANGIFLVGMFASGIDLLEEALKRLGLSTLGGVDGSAPTLTAFNDRLLRAAGGHAEDPPAVSALELLHTLASWSDEAREAMAFALAEVADSTWVWADPRLSFLAPFWSESLNLRTGIILVHRTPDQVAAATLPFTGDPEKLIDLWDRYNRSAMVLSSQYPSLILNHADLVNQPKTAVRETVEFLESLGIVVTGDVDRAAEYIGELALMSDPVTTPSFQIGPRQRTLDRLLVQLDGRRGGDGEDAPRGAGLVEVTAEFYDEEYYKTSCDSKDSDMPYSREEPHWRRFFADFAESVVETLQPKTVLDVGCAIGMLVESLRERGVDARGIDISRFAIDQVPVDLKPFCRLGSVTEELEGQYDLITCIEVLEHLPPSLAAESIANLCRHADAVLFSSTPDDFDEPTHLNVQPTSYWAKLFLRHGFLRDVDYDATKFVAPQATLFRRAQGQVDEETLVGAYERGLWQQTTELRTHLGDAMAEHNRLADRYNELVGLHETLSSAQEELQHRLSELDEALDTVRRRRDAESLAAFEAVRHTEARQNLLVSQLRKTEAELQATLNTKTFRYTNKLRGIYTQLRNRQTSEQPVALVPARPPGGTYETWIDLYDTLDDDARRRIESRVSTLVHPPTISVIMPVYNTPVDMLCAAIDSVRQQIYTEWELCIADDASSDPNVITVLRNYAASDHRIKVVNRETNGHISEASNSALSLATGDWVTCLDHDDLLAEHALALVALTLANHPDAGMVYTDEDHLDAAGRRCNAFFKPDFDPLLLLGQNFPCHLTLFRKDLVDRVGGFRVGYEGSQDWDLILRVSELLRTEQVVHIPHVLYHWRAHASSTASLLSTKPYAVDAGRQAVIDHLSRTGQSGQVRSIGKSGHNRVSWELPDPAPSVSIIVPTHDGRLLQRCLDSVFTLTLYPNFEVIVVDNASRSVATLDYLRRDEHRLTVIRDDGPFNFAAINNRAVARSSGDVVCLLNDDTEVMSAEWLSEMVSQLVQPGVGAVGAKLYYENGLIQHAGVVLGIGGVAGHSHRTDDRLTPGYYGHLLLAHRMSAVTAACIVVRRSAWDELGGLDEANLPIAFNDVDFCLRLREAGWDTVWTPYAELLHHESISRGPDEEGGPRWEGFYAEAAYMETRWGWDHLRRDPYYNPNLTLDTEDFHLAFPPRTSMDS